jgi:hypothetical protein
MTFTQYYYWYTQKLYADPPAVMVIRLLLSLCCCCKGTTKKIMDKISLVNKSINRQKEWGDKIQNMRDKCKELKRLSGDAEAAGAGDILANLKDTIIDTETLIGLVDGLPGCCSCCKELCIECNPVICIPKNCFKACASCCKCDDFFSKLFELMEMPSPVSPFLIPVMAGFAMFSELINFIALVILLLELLPGYLLGCHECVPFDDTTSQPLIVQTVSEQEGYEHDDLCLPGCCCFGKGCRSGLKSRVGVRKLCCVRSGCLQCLPCKSIFHIRSILMLLVCQLGQALVPSPQWNQLRLEHLGPDGIGVIAPVKLPGNFWVNKFKELAGEVGLGMVGGEDLSKKAFFNGLTEDIQAAVGIAGAAMKGSKELKQEIKTLRKNKNGDGPSNMLKQVMLNARQGNADAALRAVNVIAPNLQDPDMEREPATMPGFVEGDEEEDEIVLKKGDGVEANYGGKGKWFPGTISAVNKDSSYDVAYDKKSNPPGKKESKVRRDLIRIAAPATAAEEEALEEQAEP